MAQWPSGVCLCMWRRCGVQRRLSKGNVGVKTKRDWTLHGPGIEPGPPAWQARILPLNHPCPVSCHHLMNSQPVLPARAQDPLLAHVSPDRAWAGNDACVHACMEVWIHGGMRACMRGFMDAEVHGWMEANMDGFTDGWLGWWVGGWKDACMEGCMDAWVHGCMDGWMHRSGEAAPEGRRVRAPS